MAGAILVAENRGVAFSSLEFDYIIERIRSHFGDGEERVRDAIYSPVDAGGMSFISLREQDHAGFNAFARAASIAYDDERKSQRLSAHMKSWDELMSALRSDARA